MARLQRATKSEKKGRLSVLYSNTDSDRLFWSPKTLTLSATDWTGIAAGLSSSDTGHKTMIDIDRTNDSAEIATSLYNLADFHSMTLGYNNICILKQPLEAIPD